MILQHLNWGMLKLVKTIQSSKKETGIKITEEQIEMTIQKKSHFSNRIDKIIETTTITFVNDMLDELRKTDMNFRQQ